MSKPFLARINGQWFCWGSRLRIGSYTRSWDGPDEALRKWVRMTNSHPVGAATIDYPWTKKQWAQQFNV